MSRKRVSKARGTIFDPDIEHYLIKNMDLYKCSCCGDCFDIAKQSKHGHNPKSLTIDRVNNSYGYIVGNVDLLCWTCNSQKADSSSEELTRIAMYIKQQGSNV